MKSGRCCYSGNYLLFSVLSVWLIFNSCGTRQDAKLPPPPAPEFGQYISAFSGGILATDDPVQIQFAFEMIDSLSIGQQVDDELFRIKPLVSGTTLWKDTRTIQFIPEQKLPHDEVFSVSFKLGDMLNVDAVLKDFSFGFVTMPQAAKVIIEKVESYYVNQQPRLRLKGVVESADAALPEAVRQMLTLEKGFGNDHEVLWTHEARNRRHFFTINNIARKQGSQNLEISWNGKPIEAEEKGEETITLPAQGNLTLVHTHFQQVPEPRISLQFSEPIREQNLSGLLHFGDRKNLSTRISGNEITVFTVSGLTGTQVLNIESAITDIHGNRLGEKVLREFVFQNLKPAIQLTGKGMIIPSSAELLFPFRAVNLGAVDVEVVRIFEDNIIQFLQVNRLDGEDQLRRVGRKVAQRTLSLQTGNVTNFNQWNNFAVDLAEVINPEPGAIYRVYLSFKQEYSLYPCDDNPAAMVTATLNSLDTSWKSVSDEVSYWGSYDDYEYFYDYDWSQRDNPCSPSYYRNKKVSRNVLASDIGLLARQETNGTWHFTANNLLTTEPLQNVSIEIYNLQQQLLETVTTNKDGFATAKPAGVPFVALASLAQQRAYLRLDAGSSLSLSMFDVDGANVKQGIKGFIYGERGVWRPGDTLFLNFVLEDKQHTLPEAYPVVFQLYNPMGQRVQTSVNKEGVNGFYHFKALTSADAPTGNYTAAFKLGGMEFTKTLRIETIMPNRLRININFQDDALLGYASNQGTLKAEWLHGSKAGNLKAEVTATLNPARTTFNDYKNFVFDDPTRNFSSETFPVFHGQLDGNGETSLKTSFDLAGRVPGRLQATIETKVFEQGGAFSIDRFTLPFYAHKSFAGVKIPRGSGWGGVLPTDSTHTIEIVNVNTQGNKISNSKLKVDVYKVGWRWWWDSSDEYFGDFSAGSYNRPVLSQEVTTRDGKASLGFRVAYPEWGRYLVLVTDISSGHRTGDFLLIDWPSWRGSSREGMQQAATMLSFTLNQEKYEPGDELEISFPSSSGGRALVSIENGTGVLEQHWVETNNGNTVFRMKVTAEMAPNAYAHLTLLQPHGNTVNDLPIRLYGIMPFHVEDLSTLLKPEIRMADVLKPSQEVTISVKEQQGRAMTYTLALVDEGLLDLTRFKTPDPWNHFYAREALGVKTWDMYDYVMGAFGTEFSRLLGLGGDDFIQPPAAGERANRFKPVVKYFGPFDLQRGKTGTHTFTMPQYAGSVRVMVVAGNNGAYGSSEKTVPVRQSLMALGTLPRVLGPGEKVSLPVNVFAIDETIQQAQITITTNNMFTLTGSNNQQLTFNEPGDKLVWFDLETADYEGVATVQAVVKSGNESVTFDIELDVRNPNPAVTSVESVMLSGSGEETISFTLNGLPGTRDAVLEISAIPPINLEKRLKFLMAYPHGCTEQIVSGAFPQLFLDVFTEVSDDEKARIQGNIESVLGRLTSRQLGNGGISTWPGSSYASSWISSYAGHFMLQAQKKGFALNQGLLDGWLRFQKDMANRWVAGVEGFGNDQTQAYRLYTLALAGKPELGPMNRLRFQPDLSLMARWQLAAAYQLAGQSEAASELTGNVSPSADFERQTYGQYFSFTYGSKLRDQAVVVSVLSLMDKKDNAAELVKEIAGELGSEKWISTQATAFALMALADFYKGSSIENGIKASFTDDTRAAQSVNSNALIFTQDLSVSDAVDQKAVKIANQGEQPLFVRVIHSGIPAPGQEKAENQNLLMQARFTDFNGSAVDVSRLPQGTSFIATVTLSNPGGRGNYAEMALTRIFPSGWEISNARMDAASGALDQDSFTYEDIRDDRVLTYFDLKAGETKTFKVILTATYEGRFYLPGFNAETMYDASVYARNKGMWVEVVGRE